jgi:hypothetical protein
VDERSLWISRFRLESKSPIAKRQRGVGDPSAAVKGKVGFVMSPFNDKIIDVRDLPPGTLVADSTYPSEEKKYFRVP